LVGLGNPGVAFNTKRWKEMSYLISLVRNFKDLTPDQRGAVLSDPWKFAEWVGSVPRTGYRQFRHIIKNLVFPDEFERISTGRDKRDILTAFNGTTATQVKNWTDLEIDRALLEVRRRFETEHGTPFDFYLPAIQEQWKERKSVVQTLDGEVAVEIPES